MRRAPELAGGVVLVVAATAAYLAGARAGSPAASSLLGHGLGVLGALIVLTGTFGYSWRKRPGRAGPGSMAQWLRLHVLSGIVGPYLVLLHTGFVFRGLAGVTFGMMLVVVASGVAGRFVYTALPRDPAAVERMQRALVAERTARARRLLSWWWPLHVPLAVAMFALALVHALAALWYATLLH